MLELLLLVCGEISEESFGDVRVRHCFEPGPESKNVWREVWPVKLGRPYILIQTSLIAHRAYESPPHDRHTSVSTRPLLWETECHDKRYRGSGTVDPSPRLWINSMAYQVHLNSISKSQKRTEPRLNTLLAYSESTCASEDP
jgi:hypothetical protein